MANSERMSAGMNKRGDPGKGGRIKQYFATDRRFPVLFTIDIDDCDNLFRQCNG